MPETMYIPDERARRRGSIVFMATAMFALIGIGGAITIALLHKHFEIIVPAYDGMQMVPVHGSPVWYTHLKTAFNVAAVISGGVFLFGLIIYIASRVRSRLKDGVPYDERSGKGKDSAIPQEIATWNWGAAGLPIIWGMAFGVWQFWFGLIPFVNIIWFLVMGKKGNEWAWRNNKWISVEDFKKQQARWATIGSVFFGMRILSIMSVVSKYL